MDVTAPRGRVDFPGDESRCVAWLYPSALGRLTSRAAGDSVSGVLGRDPLLVPLAGQRGTVASLTTPGNKYPHWQQAVAARSAVRVGFYRPGRHASQVRCALLVLVYADDGVAPPTPAIRATRKAAQGQLVLLPGGHYEAFLDGEEQAGQVLASLIIRPRDPGVCKTRYRVPRGGNFVSAVFDGRYMLRLCCRLS